MRSTEIIIVGSGVAGISAAWPLVEAGRQVVMLDAAEHAVPAPPSGDIESFRRDPAAWRHALGDDFAGAAMAGEQSPKFGTRIGRAVLSSSADAPAVRASNFQPVRSYSAGGLSKLWGAFATEFDETDLHDYPFAKESLAASYRAIVNRIGISGLSDAHEARGEGTSSQSPSWLSPIARDLLERYEKRASTSDFTLGLAHNAVATVPIGERQACNRCGLCLYGCARNAIYDSTQDLARLRQRPNFAYRSSARVTRLIPAAGNEEPSVEFFTAGERRILSARQIILAAGTLNSTTLVLSASGSFGQKLRLLTNPVAAIAFILPAYLGTALPQSGFSLGQLSFHLIGERGADAAMGVLYTADTLPFSVLATKLPLSRHGALRLSRALSTSLLLATCYLPGRFSSNCLWLQSGPEQREELNVVGTIEHETRQMLRRAMRQLSRHMRRLGAFAIPGSLAIPTPGADGHLAGTLPMLRDGGALTSTQDGEIRPWRNIYVVDGSCLTSLPAKHCTLTIMANADRIGRNLAKKLAEISETA